MHRTTLWMIAACFGVSSCGPGIEITLTGLVNELGGANGLVDAQVCPSELEPGECVATQADGTYTIARVRGDSEMSLRVDKEGYLGGAIPVSTGSTAQSVPVISLGSSILVDLQMGILDVDAAEGTGQIAFSISNGINGDGINIADMRVGLEPSTGAGPFYSNESGLPDPDLDETSANGGGVFVNIPPGLYTLNHLNLPLNCTPMLGWGNADALSFEVMANRVTYVRVECIETGSP